MCSGFACFRAFYIFKILRGGGGETAEAREGGREGG